MHDTAGWVVMKFLNRFISSSQNFLLTSDTNSLGTLKFKSVLHLFICARKPPRAELFHVETIQRWTLVKADAYFTKGHPGK